jgi:hypothetical protein
MDALKWFAITVAVVVGEVLLLAAYVVHTTGSTDGLMAIGQMVAQVIGAFMVSMSGG